MTNLSEVCSISMGQAPEGSTYNASGIGWPLIAGAGDFDAGLARAKKFTTAPSKLSQPGDIILGIRASIGSKVFSDREYCLGRGVAGLRSGPMLDQQYLWHWLDSSKNELLSKGRGATFLQVNRNDIASLEIPLPPLPEQRRIASILDQADNLRAKSRHALGMLQDLASSQFSKIIDQSRVSDWESVPLGSISEQQGGLQVSKSRDSLQARAPYLRVANVYRGMLSLKEIKSIGVTQTELVRTQLRFGDLLIVEGHGNAGEIGRVAMWNADVRQMVHQNHLIRVRVFPLRLNAKYAEAFLNSAQSIAYWQRVAKTTSGLNTINMANVRAAPILVPPLSIQNDFVARIQDIRTVATAQEKHLASADELFASLQYRAFRGEL